MSQERYNSAAEIPPEIARRMSEADRKELGIVLPEEAQVKFEARLEKELQRDCENYLGQQEIEFLHLSPRAREKKGWPDLTFAIHGIPYAIELKTQTKVSEDQARVHKRLAANGWQVLIFTRFDAFRAFVKTVVEAG